MSNKHEQRAILFLDVLGFSRLVHEGCESLIEDALSVTSARYQSTFEVSAFSDNMAVSVQFERGYEFLELIHFSSYLTWKLLNKGVLSRGGIAVGTLHHKNGIIYGPALVEAYQLESQVAIYPRIVIAKSALEKSQKICGNQPGSEDAIRAQLRTDFDGWEHVHVMGHQAMMPFEEMLPSAAVAQQGPISNELLIQVKVDAARKALSSNPSADFRSLSKHNWMHRYVDHYENIFNHGPQWRPLPVALAMLNSVPAVTNVPDESQIRPAKQ